MFWKEMGSKKATYLSSRYVWRQSVRTIPSIVKAAGRTVSSGTGQVSAKIRNGRNLGGQDGARGHLGVSQRL